MVQVGQEAAVADRGSKDLVAAAMPVRETPATSSAIQSVAKRF